VFQGDPMQCTAECVQQPPITACVGGDMCCPAGCDETSDSDCGKPGTSNGDGSMNPGGGGTDIGGGCSTGAAGDGSAPACAGLAIFGLFALLLKRGANRRRIVRHDPVGAKRE
jgi:MYXO-CTERM domain-containing protein